MRESRVFRGMGPALLGLWLCMGFALSSATAGTIQVDFDTGLPAIATLHGSAVATGGAIRLTPALGHQLGGLAFSDQDAGLPIVSWLAEFDFRIGGGSGADGLSLTFSRLGVVGAASEEGLASGVAIGFDTFRNTGEPNGNHVSLRFDGAVLAINSILPTDLNNNQWHHTRITLDNDLVQVFLTPDGGTESQLITQTITGFTPYAGQFNFGARTGGLADIHTIDNFVAVTATPTANPEPGTWLLLGTGLVGLVTYGWRNRQTCNSAKSG